MFVGITQSGFSPTLNSPVYTEYYRCDRCRVVHHFSYTCDWKARDLLRIARLRHSKASDHCYFCRQLLRHGHVQLRLI